LKQLQNEEPYYPSDSGDLDLKEKRSKKKSSRKKVHKKSSRKKAQEKSSIKKFKKK